MFTVYYNNQKTVNIIKIERFQLTSTELLLQTGIVCAN